MANPTASEEPPRTSAHKSFYLLPYEQFDGIYAGRTDCLYLSVGLAQYDNSKVSVKTWRHTGDKYSRMSEELPVHRAIDLVIWFSVVLQAFHDGKIVVPPIFFEQTDPFEVAQEKRLKDEQRRFEEALQPDSKSCSLIRERLSALSSVLTELKEKGLI